MGIQFNADEVFEMAEQIERNGAKYYRKAAEAITEPAMHQCLLDLAAMEDGHEKTFAAMRTELSGREKGGTVADPDGQAVLYLQAMADGRVFDVKADPSEELTGGESAADVLRKAIGLEKDSVVFYLGIKEMVSESLGRDKIEGIIKEEMKHIVMLSDKLAEAEGK